MQPDLIDGTRPRRARRVMMHVIDAGEELLKFKCARCAYTEGWVLVANVSKAKRGLPCPVCNAESIRQPDVKP